MLLFEASQPSCMLIVWVLAWAKPPDGRRFDAAAAVAAAPVRSVRRRIGSSPIVRPAFRDRLQQATDQIEAPHGQALRRPAGRRLLRGGGHRYPPRRARRADLAFAP